MATALRLINTQTAKPNAQMDERVMTLLLGQRHGDGLVYMQGSEDRVVLGQAMTLGLVSEEGYLTPAGYRFWQRVEG